MKYWTKLIPYWFLLFTIGFGWFILAPLDPILATYLKASPTAIIVIIDAYGYAMAVIGLLAGYLASRITVKITLFASMTLSAVGLLGRAITSDYTGFLLFALLGASAYPLALAPVGSISSSINRERSHTIIGISVGILFIGLAAGDFTGSALYSIIGLRFTLLVPFILSLVAAASIFFTLDSYPRYYRGRKLRGSFRPGMLRNWWVGFTVASLSVMFGAIAATSLTNLHGFSIGVSISYSGLLGGLAFLGSGLGAIVLPPIMEISNRLRKGLVFTALLSFISIAFLLASFVFSRIIGLMAIGFFAFGFFGNAYWSMALTSVTKYADDPAASGFATSMYSVIANAGVSIVPVLLGPLFYGHVDAIYGTAIVIIMVLLAAIVSPFLKVRQEVGSEQ
ncbi:MAG: MFS transporter [Candidatus Thermoplasmatota archaeon]|nr:MFS transporter [Candidatus Thermoplasmatota archaeon]